MAGDLDRTLAALADPNRRAIVERLRARPQRPSEVADALSMSRPRDEPAPPGPPARRTRLPGGLEDDARARLVSLRTEPLTRLRAWVEDVEAMWADQLDAFKAHAERVHRSRRR